MADTSLQVAPGLIQVAPALIKAIQKKYPELSEKQVVKLIRQLESDIAKHILAGDDLAFLSRQADGSWDLTVYAIERLENT